MTTTMTPPTAAPSDARPPSIAEVGPRWTGADPASPWVATARELVPTLASHAAAHDRDGSFAAEGMAALREHGVTTMLVPADLGGGGATFAEACAVLAALAHGDPATALTLSMHTHLVAAQVWRHRRGLPAPVLARVVGERAVLVSTGASDWIDSEGTAEPIDGGYRVNGRKSPSSGAPAGDLLVTSARTDGPDGPQVIHFAVPFGAPGVRIESTWDAMGMRATGSHTVVLEDVVVPEAAVSLTRPAGRWHPVFDTIVGAAMPLIMSVYVGVAEAAADRAVTLVARRSRPAAAAPLLGRMLSRLAIGQDTIGATIASCRDLGFDATDEHASQVLMRKAAAAEALIETVRLAMEAVGGAAYDTSTGLERLYRDVHGALYHPLPASRQEPFCGRLALGLDPIGVDPAH